MSKNKNIIRIGDRVNVITPIVFFRCGYPLTAQIVKDTLITKDHKDAVILMLKAFGIYKDSYESEDNLTYRNTILVDKIYENIIHTMSMAVMEREGWGGTERKIYTEYNSNFTEVICQVLSKRVIKTGTYHRSSGGHDYYNGADDYDPAYLGNEKTHIILKLCTDGFNENVPMGMEFEIEQCNVVKI